VRVRRITSPGDGLHITVKNTGAPLEQPGARDGVGLTNVTRRLVCYYGDAATLDLRRDDDGATLAELRLPLADRDDHQVASVARAGKV
jgi:LytS/YehU family sensor histidine kinase